LDKADIEKRLNTIVTEMTQMRNNYTMLEGHLNECRHWLVEIEKKESANGEINNEGTEQNSEQGLCGTEGEEIPDGGPEPRSECESPCPATVQ